MRLLLLGEAAHFQVFFLISKPHTGFYSTAFLPLPPDLHPTKPSPPQWFVGQLWRAGAAAGASLYPQPCRCGLSRKPALAGTSGGPGPNLLAQVRLASNLNQVSQNPKGGDSTASLGCCVRAAPISWGNVGVRGLPP